MTRRMHLWDARTNGLTLCGRDISSPRIRWTAGYRDTSHRQRKVQVTCAICRRRGGLVKR